MSTLTISSPVSAPGQSYLKNVACAALGLLNALLAVSPRETVPAAQDRAELYRLANSYEAVSPSLARELRFFAGRD
jgi:hypothetical protein